MDPRSISGREMTLFVSTPSKASMELLNFIRTYRVPGIKNIFLDTKESRKWAASGVPHPITSVPTLLVKTPDGRAALYIGFEKIAKLLSPLVTQEAPPNDIRNDSHNPTNGRPSGNKNPSEEEVSRMPEPQRDFHTLPSTKKALIINSYEKPSPPPRQPRVYRPDFDGVADSRGQNEPLSKNRREDREKYHEEASSERMREESPEPKKKPSRPKKAEPVREPPRKRVPIKKTKVVESDSESISEDSDSSEEHVPQVKPKKKVAVVKSRPAPKSSKKSVSSSSKKSSMKDIHEKAKEMEKDRKKSLGYDEKDLPST